MSSLTRIPNAPQQSDHPTSSVSAAYYPRSLGGLPRRRCPSWVEACFPFQVRGSSVFLNATKPLSTVSIVMPRLVAARLMAARRPRALCPSTSGTRTG